MWSGYCVMSTGNKMANPPPHERVKRKRSWCFVVPDSATLLNILLVSVTTLTYSVLCYIHSEISHVQIGLWQGWANSGPPLRVLLWPAKTVRKIRLEPRFPSHARPKIRLVFSTRTATSIRMRSVDTHAQCFSRW
jgi:hypothetical protein